MFFITRTLVFISNLIILIYIYLLKKNNCDCSQNYKRDIIFYYTISYIFIIISFITFPRFFRVNYMLSNALKLYLGLFLFVNVYMIYKYTEELEKKKCDCSDNLGRDIMKIYAMFYIFLLVLIFLIVCSDYIKNADKLTDFNSRNNKFIHIPILKKV